MTKRKVKQDNKRVKKNNIRNKKIIRKLVFLILVIILAVLLYYLLNNGHKLGLSFNKELTEDDAYKIALTDSDNIVETYSDKIIVYETGNMKVYNKKGTLLYENDVENIYSPEINTAGSYIQLVNDTTGDVFIFNGKYQVGSISLDKEIISSKITENGTSLIHYKALGTKSALGIFDKEGNELYKINLDSNFLNDYLLTDDNRYLVYVEPDIEGISIVTNVNLIDLKSTDKEVNCIVSKENEIVYDINIKNNNITMLTDSTVISYNIHSKVTNEESITEIDPIDIAINNLKYVYTVSDTEDDGYVICNISKINNEKDITFQIKEQQKYFKVLYDLIVIGCQSEVYIYNMYGLKIKDIKINGVVTDPILFNNGKNLLMVISNNVLIFNI